MNPSSSGVFVACTANAIYVRVVGRGACRNAPPLREYGLRKLQEGCQSILVDLHACEAVDSTFLGVFAGFGIALGRAGCQGKLTLVEMSQEVRRALVDLGLDQIASIETDAARLVHGDIPPPEAFELLPGSDLGARSRPVDIVDEALLMLEAHETLCSLDQRNEAKFRDVKEFLRQDIARHSREPLPGAPNAPQDPPCDRA